MCVFQTSKGMPTVAASMHCSTPPITKSFGSDETRGAIFVLLRTRKGTAYFKISVVKIQTANTYKYKWSVVAFLKWC